MDHARIKIFFYSLLFILSACSSRKPEEQLIHDIEEKYSNLYINNEAHKRAVIKDLKEFLKTHPLNDENIPEINKRLNQINDGHVVLFDDRKDKGMYYISGLTFVNGSDLVESCNNCSPAIPKYKYEILEINDVSISDYLKSEQHSVAASTEWGRHFRIMRLLQERHDSKEITLKLKSFSGRITTTKLNWELAESLPITCVSGERVKNNVYKLNINSLWCDDSRGNGWSRDQIFNNFKNKFDEATKSIGANDKIIIDLRENGGGGDLEVEYVVNAFLEKSVFLYRYKYLRKMHPGKRKWLEQFYPFKLSLWADIEYDYSKLENRPKKTFFNNKVVTLISGGCFSSCETIASVLKHNKRSELLGSNTHGGSGDPVIFPIKHTPYSINLPTCITWQQNGEAYEGRGVSPSRPLEQNLSSKGDSILRAAIDLVQ